VLGLKFNSEIAEEVVGNGGLVLNQEILSRKHHALSHAHEVDVERVGKEQIAKHRVVHEPATALPLGKETHHVAETVIADHQEGKAQVDPFGRVMKLPKKDSESPPEAHKTNRGQDSQKPHALADRETVAKALLAAEARFVALFADCLLSEHAMHLSSNNH
jgi:hypothetical protein